MILKKINITNKDKEHYNIQFIDEIQSEIQYPYCSVIIGNNGTGKSFLLSQIADFVTKWSEEKHRYQYSDYSLEYNKDNKDILVFAENHCIKNYDNPKIRVLTVSFLVNDKFESREYYRNENYKYLGVRRASNGAAYRENIEKLVIKQLLSKETNSNKKQFICKILKFLELEEKLQLKIKLSPKYHPENIKTNEKFKKLIKERLNNELYRATKTKTKYQKILEELGKEGYEKILALLEKVYEEHKKYILAKACLGDEKCDKDDEGYFIDLLEYQNEITEQMFDILWGLEFIPDEMLTLYKNSKQFMFKWAASGEKQLFYSLMNIQNNITNNSLILIDEPETSLHPNWQMNYIRFLKEVFKGYKCHFIIATHSPHLISDLHPDSSSVIVLNRNKDGIIQARPYPTDTYAWSAENILYNVFGVRTTRNYYFEQDVRELMELLTDKQNIQSNKKEINKLKIKLSKYALGKNDPLRRLLELKYD